MNDDRGARGGSRSPARSASRLALWGWVWALANVAGCHPLPLEKTIVVGSPGGPATLRDAVGLAGAGDLIVLPEGTFPGGVTLPPGVGLRGSGYARTLIDSAASTVGIEIRGGQGALISDLTIRASMGSGLQVDDSRDVSIRRVRVLGCLDGIRMTKVTRGRVENAVVADNRYGIIVGEGRDVTVVNCTLARNAAIGLSLPTGRGIRAFNNCIVGNSTGVYLGEEIPGLVLDHNLNFNLFAGKANGQTGRKMLSDWSYLTGLDAHSVRMPLQFRDAASGNFVPTGTLGWALDRCPTSDWGAARLADVDAPGEDIDGAPRAGLHDVGAYEVRPVATRPPDGTINIKSDDGLKSAGIYRTDGIGVGFLFHNLPLKAGPYPYWFPHRDGRGRPIAAGQYEVRTVESDLRWAYLGHIGDDGADSPPLKTAPVKPGQVVFGDDGQLFSSHGWSEDATNVRAYNAKGEVAWSFPGHAMLHGMFLGEDGSLGIIREAGKNAELTRIDPKTGGIHPKHARLTLPMAHDVAGAAELAGRLFVADPKGNRVRIFPVGSIEPAGEVALKSPSSPWPDRKAGVVWVISEGRTLVAIGPDGRKVSEVTPIPSPVALGARDGRLLVASKATGKIHEFDATSPGSLRPTGLLGRGDGPFGPYLPDRFLFQQTAQPNVSVAPAPGGGLAVVDDNRQLVFDAGSKLLWSTFGVFGNGTAPAHGEPTKLYDTGGRRSFRLDEERGTWAPGSYLDIPPRGQFFGSFAEGGRVFGVQRNDKAGTVGGELLVTLIEGDRARSVLGLVRDAPKGPLIRRKDRNGDGQLTPADRGEPVRTAAGRDPGGLFARFNSLRPDGSLMICDADNDHWLTYWACRGLDAEGLPIYRIEDRYPLRRNPKVPWISPYTHKPESPPGLYGADRDDRGDVVANVNIASSPTGTGLSNTSGTDLIGLSKGGDLRWVHTLGDRGGIMGISSVGGVSITGVATTDEIVAVDHDGLGLGGFGPPARVHYEGYFLDHPEAVRLYKGQDGRPHALIADNYSGRHHWYRCDGDDRIVRTTTPAVLPSDTARLLASEPDTLPDPATRPSPPVVRIPRLAAPLVMDGDLIKWRRAGVVPQLIVTPETSHGAIDGPQDCSAIVRLAHEGGNLYAQFLVFDDVVSYHQGVDKHHAQDGVELCINGFLKGFKFDATQTTDLGPTVLRNRFFAPKLTLPLTTGHTPRSFRVLDDAKEVDERGLIEVVYGVDLSKCRVRIIEFRLPIDETNYDGGPEALKDLVPFTGGRTFWLGLLINDNDSPGTDLQDYMLWPNTYTNFGPIEDGARAVLE